MLREILDVLPDDLRKFSDENSLVDVEEIRLRAGQPVSFVKDGMDLFLARSRVTKSHIAYILSAASKSSLYAVNDALREGYITLPGGHRIGLCGQAVLQNGQIQTIRDISSVNIRIAREKIGIGAALHESTLIIGPPGCGKTTLLRDCVRILSDEIRCRISIVDERCEIAACCRGIPQFHVGQRTDVLSGCGKELGISMVLRSMNPQWIIVDEITQERDVEAISRAAYCGVHFAATAHAADLNDLQRRSVYRSIISSNVFREVFIMHRDHSYTRQVL